LLKPFKVGDYIEQGSYAGFVESIQIFNTTLRTYDARKIIVPNTELATKSLVNHFNLPQRRIAIQIGVAYGESVDKAKEVLLKVANDNPQVLQEPKPPFATLEKFGESSLNMTLYAWTLPENYWTTLYSLNEEVYAAFRREGIEIPFNQMDVHIRKEE
jgi:small conductance mechanosensitive channel